MRKVTKIFTMIVSTVILLLILLPVVGTLLLSMPSMQNRAVRWATDFASEKLGTTVSIDHITVGMLNHIKVRGLYVEDLDGDTLLYARSVTAQLGPLATMSEQLTINSGRAENVVFYLRETERGPMNVKEITDKLTNPNKQKKSPFRLVIRSLDADSLDFRLMRLEKRNPEFGVDYSDMHIGGIDGHIENFYVDGAAVGGNVTSINFWEQSGFVLDDMSGEFSVDKGVITLKDATLIAKESQINIPTMTLKGRGWDGY